MSKVMAFGSFDVIHPGHMYYLKHAKSLGKELIVVVARDSSIKRIKHIEPKYQEQERLEHIRSLPYVDKAILGKEEEHHFEIVKKYKPDILALGYDHRYEVEELKQELKKMNLKTDVIRIKSYKPHQYKSSKLKGTNK